MLVLTRKINESILITDELTGESIQIMVTSAHSTVRLGIEATQRFRIERLDAGKAKEFIRGDDPIQRA